MNREQLSAILNKNVFNAVSEEDFEYTLIFTGESSSNNIDNDYHWAFECYDRDYISFWYYPNPTDWRTGKLQEMDDEDFVINVSLSDFNNVSTNMIDNIFKNGATIAVTTELFKVKITFTGYQKKLPYQTRAEAYEAYDDNDTQYWYYPYSSTFNGDLEVPEDHFTYVATLSYNLLDKKEEEEEEESIISAYDTDSTYYPLSDDDSVSTSDSSYYSDDDDSVSTSDSSYYPDDDDAEEDSIS